MKNVMGIFLAGMMAINCLGFSQNAATADAIVTQAEEEPTVGGWAAPESPAITEEIQALCDKALEGLTGASYTPAALLATQVVAGTNYRILFRSTPAILNGTETYAIGTLYQDLDGDVELTDLQISDIATDFDELEGGWMPADSPALSEEISEIFSKAMEGLTGVDYTPLALLGTQVVAGTNYAIICEATVVYPDAEPYYAIVYVSENLDGIASLLDIASL